MATQTLQSQKLEQKMALQIPTNTSQQAWQAVNSKGRSMPIAGQLISPPQDIADSFSQHGDRDASEQVVKGWEEALRLPPINEHTPPTSPEDNTLPSITSATGFPAHDPPLFSEPSQSDSARSHTPLFPPSPEPLEPAVRLASPLSTKCYPSNLGIKTSADALQYWRECMASVRRSRPQSLQQLPSPRVSKVSSLDDESKRQLSSLTRTRQANALKSRSAPKTATKPKAVIAASVQKTSPPRRRTPNPRTSESHSISPSAQPSTKHKRAPPTKKVEQADVRWTEIPDYAPPTSTLDSSARPLKATWHGHQLDLSNDPDRAYLHSQEIGLASILRLKCADYLTVKRKIFRARLEALKQGKNFTKTAAQGACSMDVNKASQLWEAFDKQGWFKESWFEKWL